ncbi:hypothetical protein [Anthocerotibacter panamensis]|uniref:hypothetical protein n=1 Tax=Anthocerotibacter panamensis TaxID=2857077 RepID=UPI001C4077B3|nr:hypothetical protein [Anthocerotibacter panamensis]
MQSYPYTLTKVFDTQAGFECFWQGLKRLDIQKARALYHGRTRRFRVDLPCADALLAERIEELDTQAHNLEEQALALENLLDPDLTRRFED